MSEAYASTLDISFDVRGGLLMRQMHHWSAMLFVASMLVHLMRVFFTGAFRKPRELNWVIGCLLLMLGTLEGFTGYSLPDDLLSGTGIRAADGFVKSMPVVGTYISFFMFDGEFPGDAIISRLYTAHVLLIPGILLALIGAHMLLLVFHKHTQWPGPGRTNDNVVGYPLLPVYTAKAGGFFFIVFGITALMGGLLTLNPVWRFGPYDPSQVTAGSQPDWYMGWPDGALRIFPGWETHLWGFTLSWNVFLPIIVLPGVMFTILLMLPFLESWITGDKREHHLLQRPRNAPNRTATMVALMTFYGILWAAGGNDIIAIKFHLNLNYITYFNRVAVFVGPVLAFWHHPALVHLAPARRPEPAAARLRDRRHHALPRGRLRREAPADLERRGLHPHRPRPRRGSSPTPDRGGRERRRQPQGQGDAAARQAVAVLGRPTTSRSRPARSSRRPGTTPSTSWPSTRTVTSTSPAATTRATTSSTASPADGHQFDGRHSIEGDELRK